MKKILAFLLATVMLFALCACGSSEEKKDDTKTPATTTKAPADNDGDKAETLKFGLGVYVAAATATDATEDKAGAGSVDATYAAVSVDANGKIVAAAIDAMQHKVSYTTTGTTSKGEFKSKYELGDAYNKVAYGGAKLEWYAQADAFESVVIGKTLDEVKALIAEGGKGNDAVINAGCTIAISDFVNAIEEAYNNAKASDVTAAHTLKIAASVDQSATDATEDKAGSNELNTTIFAAAVDAEGKIVAAASDCLQVKFTFDLTGKSTFDTAAEILTKREKGDAYGMVAYGGSAKEWYAQADAFDAACIGKTAAEIAGLMGADYKGIDSLQAAGCTIYVSGFVAAASKI